MLASGAIPSGRCARSIKLFAGALGLILLLAVVTLAVPASDGVPRDVSSMLRVPVLLHQTVQSRANLTERESAWQRSWVDLGFQLQLADNARCRQDMVRLSELTGDVDFVRVYDALETGVQRSDMWRYAALYLYGGVYARPSRESAALIAMPPRAA